MGPNYFKSDLFTNVTIYIIPHLCGGRKIYRLILNKVGVLVKNMKIKKQKGG